MSEAYPYNLLVSYEYDDYNRLIKETYYDNNGQPYALKYYSSPTAVPSRTDLLLKVKPKIDKI